MYLYIWFWVFVYVCICVHKIVLQLPTQEREEVILDLLLTNIVYIYFALIAFEKAWIHFSLLSDALPLLLV